jgi:hypothetical protein
MRKAEDTVPWVVAACVTLFYLCFHSTFYNFDGVACAIAVELSDLRHLTHGNHLAYGIVGLAWTHLWRYLDYTGPALVPLQALDSILGGLGAGLFYRLLRRRLGVEPLTAVSATAGLALSYAWWFWSLEAQVYMLGALFLILAADSAWAEAPNPWLVGLLHGLAILGHVGNAMFILCAAFLLRGGGRAKYNWPRYAAALAFTVLAAYAAAAIWCVRPRTADEWRIWLLGSAALSKNRSFVWFTSTASENVVSWLSMSLRIFTDPLVLSRPWWSAAGWLLCLGPLAAAAAETLSWTRPAKACLLWLGGYAILYHSWQPSTMVYRITDLIPIWLLAALFARTTLRRWSLVGWVLAMGLGNGIFIILPQTDPRRNTEYQETLWVAANTPPDAWVAVNGRDEVYLPYFTGRKPLNLHYYVGRPDALADRLREIEGQGLPIFITSTTLHRQSGWEDFFRDYGLRLEASGADQVLYRIGTNGNPKGSRQKKLKTAPAAKNGPNGTGSSRRNSPRTTRPTP